MNIKELLLEGCSVSISYKKKKTDWVGDVKIYIFAGGFGMKTQIIVDGTIGRHVFDVEKIDEAIEFFNSKVFTDKNLWYKHNEAMRIASKTVPDIDLDDCTDFKIYEKIRLELVSKANK